MPATKVPGKRPSKKRPRPSTADKTPRGDDDDFAHLAVQQGDMSADDSEEQNQAENAEPADATKAPEQAQANLKPRKKKQRKGNVAYQESQAAAAEVADSNPEEQARWLLESYKKAVGESFLEQEALTGDCIIQLSGHGSVEDQLKAATPDWQKAFCDSSGRSPGQPSCLLVSAAALGAIAMIKSFPTFNKACRIAKLFAKHLKVTEQQEYLQQHPICIAAGTPNRLCKLADIEALQLSNLTLIILDVSQDAKQRTILDLPETNKDFWALFSRHCQQRLQQGLTKICLVRGSKSDATQ